MKIISLKLDDPIFQETQTIVSSLNLPRNRYINEALKHFNKLKRRELLLEQLKFESKLVEESSMEVLREFEAIEYAD